MAQDELDAFFDAVRRDRSLAEAFAAAAADVARNNGFDLDDQDFIDRFHGEEPEARPLPPGTGGGGRHTMAATGAEGPRATTMAMGEEGSPRPVPPVSVTLAIGEEDRRATGGIGEDTHKGKPVTSAALGEEDRPVDPPKPPADDDAGFGKVTTLALGEEEKRRKPAPKTDDDAGTVTSMALGEEDKRKPAPKTDDAPVTSMALGEEEKRRDPPALPITTQAVGEEEKMHKRVTKRAGEDVKKKGPRP